MYESCRYFLYSLSSVFIIFSFTQSHIPSQGEAGNIATYRPRPPHPTQSRKGCMSVVKRLWQATVENAAHPPTPVRAEFGIAKCVVLDLPRSPTPKPHHESVRNSSRCLRYMPTFPQRSCHFTNPASLHIFRHFSFVEPRIRTTTSSPRIFRLPPLLIFFIIIFLFITL